MARDQSNREKNIRKYFRGTSTKLLMWSIIIGLVVAVVVSTATEFPPVGIISGLVIAGGGIYLSIRGGQGKPSDQEMDAWLQDGIAHLSEESIKTLGLPVSYNDDGSIASESLQTLRIKGPVMWSRPGIHEDDLVAKKGDDGIARFGIYNVVILHLTPHHLASYQCNYNFLRDVALNVETNEYPYEHIVTVSTREEASNYTLPTGVKMTHSEQFRISVSSGESITVGINFPELRERTGGDLPDSGAQQAINVIRSRLRDRASGNGSA